MRAHSPIDTPHKLEAQRPDVQKGERREAPGGRFITLCFGVSILLVLAGCGDLFRVFFPSNHHDESPPALAETMTRPAVLVFSKTNGFRHSEAIDRGVPVLESMIKRKGWDFFYTENGAVHEPQILERFDLIIWFQQSGNVLSEDQRAALRSWIEAGGSFFGVHGTGGDPSYDWAWQPETLVGAQFTGHPMGPQFQEAKINVEAIDHPTMQGLPSAWTRVDEWYSFEKSPRSDKVQVLATLDESTYSPRMKIAIIDRDLRMGEDHPIIWTHCIGRGHALYSALGHTADSYSERNHLAFLENSMNWLTSASAEPCIVP